MKKIVNFLCMVCGVTAMAQPTASDVWINEFHYDGVTTFGQSDQNEFLEVVVKKTLYNNAVEFAKLKVVLYTSGALDQPALNAGRGLPYNQSSLLYSLAETELPLTGFTACMPAANEYVILSRTIPLQDIPAGFALVYNNSNVVQLLSYEKQFSLAPAAAGGGAAAGLTTTVIRTSAGDTASENALTLNNHSISLVGNGVSYSNFTWSGNVLQTATPCAVNAGQTLASSAPLPIKWLDFRATGKGDRILTSWLVSDDTETARYEVEIRKAAQADFSKKSAITRQAASNGRYSAELHHLPAGQYLVRVKSIETGGRYVYSAERMVRLGKDVSQLTVYPNPVRSAVAFLQFASAERGVYTIQITDATGRLVKQQSLGRIMENQLVNFSLDLQELAPGTYQVKVKGATEEMNARIVVVK